MLSDHFDEQWDIDINPQAACSIYFSDDFYFGDPPYRDAVEIEFTAPPKENKSCLKTPIDFALNVILKSQKLFRKLRK